jgi:hypothetical protein
MVELIKKTTSVAKALTNLIGVNTGDESPAYRMKEFSRNQ